MEHDHWKERRRELDYVLKDLKDVEEDPYQEQRPPWLPHPEVRETVPNISLYSVLFKFPNKIDEADRKDHQSELEWQLEYASTFFDECVPNMPGFSSSVAAVTILPDPKHLATAWKKWKRLAKRVRRLRFIRHVKRNKQREAWMKNKPNRASGIRGSLKEIGNFRDRKDLDEPKQNQSGNEESQHDPDLELERHHSISPISDDEQVQPKHHRTVLSNEDIEHVLSSPDTFETKEQLDNHEQDLNPILEPEDKTPVSRSLLVESFPYEERVSKDENPTGSHEGTGESTHPEPPALPQSTENENLSAVPESSPLVASQEGKPEPDSTRSSSDEQAIKPITPGSAPSKSLDALAFQTPIQKQAINSIPLTIDTKPDFSMDKTMEGVDTFNMSSIRHSQDKESNHFSYTDFDQAGYARQIGLFEESEIPSFMDGFGVEQTAVYCREYSRTSAPCCPFGCNEDGVKNATLEELEDMEAEAIEEVQHANVELHAIRSVVNRTNLNSGQSFGHDEETIDPVDRASESSFSDEPKAIYGTHTRHEYWESSNQEYDPESNSLRGSPRDIRRRKLTTDSSMMWDKVNNIVMQTASTPKASKNSKSASLPSTTRTIDDGKWRKPSIQCVSNLFLCGRDTLMQQSSHMQAKIKEAAHKSGHLAKQVTNTHTYAVVTLTSRQAAIAARQCLSDGSGLNAWREDKDIPIPPLADSAPCSLDCRGCCRPVTLTIQDWQKIARLYL